MLGDSAVVVLDASVAGFGVGTNDALSATWLLLDAFAAGDPLAP